MKWNTIKLLEDSQRLNLEAGDKREDAYVFNYRGGNAGAVIPWKGILTPTGACPRLIHLRSWLRWQPDENTDVKIGDSTISAKHLMFDGGLANEHVWDLRLKAALPDTHILLSEEELGLKLTLPNGLPFSGRPDHVYCRKGVDGAPPVVEHVLEHKGVHSIWTARNVMFEKKPKFQNILQTAIYSHLLERRQNTASTETGRVSGELIYSSYVNYVTNPMVERILPRYGDKDSEWMAYHFYRVRLTKRSPKGWTKDKITEQEYLNERGSFIKVEGKSLPTVMADANYIKPFVIAYDVRVCHDGAIEWKVGTSTQWIPLGVHVDNMFSLYKMADDMRQPEAYLPPIPVNLTAYGKEENYDACTYCALKDLCKRKHANVGEWKKDVKNEFALDKFPNED